MSSTHGWNVVTLELTEPLPQLERERGRAGIWAIFSVRGVPLGHVQIPTADLPVAPGHLAILAAHAVAVAVGDRVLAEGFRSANPGLPPPACSDPLDALEALVGLEEPVSQTADRLTVQDAGLSITVAICTRERPEALERCLHSVMASSLRPQQILVIDNAPLSDATASVVDRFPGVQYHCEPGAGLSRARNTALELATGDIVAYADDDVVVHRDWLASIRGGFSDPQVMVTTGLVLPAELETESQLLFEKSFQFFHQGYRRRYFDSAYFSALRGKGVPVWQIGAGANMAIRRKAYELGYRFYTGLGPGVFGGCGEDSEFWYRMLAEGWSCLYEPSACVYHFHRRELGGLKHLLHQYMKGHVAALILQFARYGHVGNLRRLVLQLPAEYLLLLLRSIPTGFSKDCRLLLRGALGCASGLRFAFVRKGPFIQRT
jgi:glycosyltransferase involved in cell wall biosynthesis